MFLKYFSRICVFFFCLFLAGACNPSRRVAQGEYLLNSVRLKVNDRSVPVAEIKTQLTQQPNERILGARFHLWLYNISNPSRDSEFRQGLRKAGEEPVIWKQEETEKSKQQILSLLMSRGYFYAQVKDTIRLHRKKAEVLYRVDLGIPYRIGRVDYDIKDPGLRAPVLSDTLNSEIKSGALLDQQLLTKERSRIESLLRQSGYYAFSEDYIHYKVDTFFRTHTANVQVLIENIPGRDSLGRSIERPHQTYIIKSITVDIQPGTVQEDPKRNLKNDTVVYPDMTFISPSKPLVKPLTVSQFIQIRPDTLYNVLDEENTYQRLSRLRSFRLVNIRFEESFQRDTLSKNRFLDARISLSPFKRHSLSADFQATYAKGDPGGAVVLNYQNLSLFRNAGIFNLRTRIAMESLKERGEGLFHNTKEYGAEASLDLPRFLLFRKEKRLPDHANSRTILSVGYNYLQRPEYRRTVSSLSLGYTWGKNAEVQHSLKPIDFYYVNSEISDTYRELIKGMFIESSYIPHTILGASYGLTLTNQQSPDYHTFSYWAKMNVESAGALLYAGTSLLNTSRDADGYRSFLGRPFSQYVRADLDFRLYQFLGGSSGLSKMVYRFYLGVGSPYANSSVLPFEKRFYSGGAYGIRGWRIYSLGPGSFRDPNTSYSSTGDIRLEFNVENRFKLFWILEGALFVDAGNVWDAKKDPKRPGANFEWNRFLSEMAVSSGFGLRFDFSFVVGRFDVGIKMRDPVDGFLWNRGILMDDITYNFGIGYPF